MAMAGVSPLAWDEAADVCEALSVERWPPPATGGRGGRRSMESGDREHRPRRRALPGRAPRWLRDPRPSRPQPDAPLRDLLAGHGLLAIAWLSGSRGVAG